MKTLRRRTEPSCTILAAVASALPFFLWTATHATAQTAPPTGVTATAPAATPQQHNLYRGSKIIGSNVRDARDRKIGQIKDLILDGPRGEIAYAVVNFGGVMGVGRKFHAIPWRALEPGDSGNYYILHADRETIDLAPGFDKGRWPDMTDRKWRDEIDRYWSRMAGKGAPGNQSMISGSRTANPTGTGGGADSSGR